MKYVLLIISITFIVGSLFYFGVFNKPNAEQGASGQTAWETRTDTQPPVTVKITPVAFGKDAEMWKFKIVFDTHAGSLDDDPVKTILLSDNNGKTYQALSWDGPGPGGHHREGMLTFNAINPSPLRVTLTVKDVGNIPERSFTWNM